MNTVDRCVNQFVSYFWLNYPLCCFQSTEFYGVFRNHGLRPVWIEYFLNLNANLSARTVHVATLISFKTNPCISSLTHTYIHI
jgi:hypothetical protein